MTHPAPVLLADVGGTNTRIALADGLIVRDGSIARVPNKGQPGLEDILAEYLAKAKVIPSAVAVAIAGPVRGDTGKMTNLNWTVTAQNLAAATKADKVAILNDMQAQGHALAHLTDASFCVIKAGEPAPKNATRMVIGLGTGLNSATVVTGTNGTMVPPSESGHISLPIGNAEQVELAQFLQQRHGFAAVEDVLSGRGLPTFYEWVAGPDAPALTAAEITDQARDGTNPAAVRCVALFARLMGQFVGNLALIQLPFGGIYLIGGVARAVEAALRSSEFIEGFRDKGRFSEFMDQFSINLITDDYAALTGLASHLKEVAELG